jgi:hypothetical protein
MDNEWRDKRDRQIIEAGKNTRFGSPGGPDPRQGGRKKTIRNLLRDQGYTGEDIRAAGTILGFMTAEELSETVSDETKPIIVRVIGGALLKSLQKTNLRTVKELLDIVTPPKSGGLASSGPVEITIRREEI